MAPGTKWIKLDLGDLTDLADLPEATPTKAKAGINDLVLVRTATRSTPCTRSARTPAVPLPQGTVEDGCLVCPGTARGSG